MAWGRLKVVIFNGGVSANVVIVKISIDIRKKASGKLLKLL
jgi:hypothetical protein